MVSESDFRAALDADPFDHALRLVFADWLEEQGDWRAAGYRWMGVTKLTPVRIGEPPVILYRAYLSFANFSTRREAEESTCRAVAVSASLEHSLAAFVLRHAKRNDDRGPRT